MINRRIANQQVALLLHNLFIDFLVPYKLYKHGLLLVRPCDDWIEKIDSMLSGMK